MHKNQIYSSGKDKELYSGGALFDMLSLLRVSVVFLSPSRKIPK
jgi:hypothetical protein